MVRRILNQPNTQFLRLSMAQLLEHLLCLPKFDCISATEQHCSESLAMSGHTEWSAASLPTLRLEWDMMWRAMPPPYGWWRDGEMRGNLLLITGTGIVHPLSIQRLALSALVDALGVWSRNEVVRLKLETIRCFNPSIADSFKRGSPSQGF